MPRKIGYFTILSFFMICLDAESADNYKVNAAESTCYNTIRAIKHGIFRNERDHIIRHVPYNGHGIILDSNLMIALKEKGFEHLGESSWHGQLKKMVKTASKQKKQKSNVPSLSDPFRFWVSSKIGQEVQDVVRRKKISFEFPESTRILPINEHTKAEYDQVYNKLRSLSIGGDKVHDNVNDRDILTEVFFSKTTDNVTPVFATADKGIINPLCKTIPNCASALRRNTMRSEYRDGFDFTIHDESTGISRTVRILPIYLEK
tara:strand:+ start:48652 stop:49434 length:783 start_codon:yes stop_codon:yes gene_type:complete